MKHSHNVADAIIIPPTQRRIVIGAGSYRRASMPDMSGVRVKYGHTTLVVTPLAPIFFSSMRRDSLKPNAAHLEAA